MTILVLLFFVPILVAILLGANLLLATHQPDSSKVDVYECGIPVISAQTRNPFSVSYYLVGILFLIFDLEIALVFPVAVSLNIISSYGFWVAIAFLALLTVGFVYELGRGAVNFTAHRSALIRPETNIVE